MSPLAAGVDFEYAENQGSAYTSGTGHGMHVGGTRRLDVGKSVKGVFHYASNRDRMRD